MKKKKIKIEAAAVSTTDQLQQRPRLLTRKEKLSNLRIVETKLVTMLRKTKNVKPEPCVWLSEETYVLPEVVNIVRSTNLVGPCLKTKLDLVRFGQHLPNSKYRTPNFPSISIRLYPTMARLFQSGNMELIKTTNPGMGLYFSHLYRQLIEKIPLILVDMGPNGEVLGKPYIGTLEGYLGFSFGVTHNIVGNGVLPQDGVHLTNLLNFDRMNTMYDPGSFPNLIYRGKLQDGSRFCANIANTGKVVVMGLKTKEGVYEAYKNVCEKVHNFEDPNVPNDPTERWRYRLTQLYNHPSFKKEADDPEGAKMSRYAEHAGDEYDMDQDDDDEDEDGNGNFDIEIKIENEQKNRTDVLESIMRDAEQYQVQSNTAGGSTVNPDGVSLEMPVIYEAAFKGQVDNVKALLIHDFTAVPYEHDPTNEELVAALEAIPTKTIQHTQIIHLIKNHFAAAAPGTREK